MAHKEVPPYVKEHYDVENEIAKGKYGVVYKCVAKATNSPVAVKVMLRRHNKKEDVEREVSILRQISHPNLLEFTDYVQEGSNFILVTELLTGGELFDYCTSVDYLSESEAGTFMAQILSGLEYIHAKNICHLDLKPENIVLKTSTSKELKIIDFGTAQDLSQNKGVKAMVGTPEFIAPEVLNFDPVSCAADMWAVGVIAFCLLTGCSPFLGDNDGETFQNVTAGEFDFPDPDPEEGYDDISDSAKDFISSLIVLSPKKRLSVSGALEHTWLTTNNESRISTDRLKRLRRRRKLLAAIQAVRVTVGLFRTFSTCKNDKFDTKDDQSRLTGSLERNVPPLACTKRSRIESADPSVTFSDSLTSPTSSHNGVGYGESLSSPVSPLVASNSPTLS